MGKFKIPAKLLISLGMGVIGIAETLITKKQKEIEKAAFKEEIVKEVMETLFDKED